MNIIRVNTYKKAFMALFLILGLAPTITHSMQFLGRTAGCMRQVGSSAFFHMKNPRAVFSNITRDHVKTGAKRAVDAYVAYQLLWGLEFPKVGFVAPMKSAFGNYKTYTACEKDRQLLLGVFTFSDDQITYFMPKAMQDHIIKIAQEMGVYDRPIKIELSANYNMPLAAYTSQDYHHICVATDLLNTQTNERFSLFMEDGNFLLEEYSPQQHSDFYENMVPNFPGLHAASLKHECVHLLKHDSTNLGRVDFFVAPTLYAGCKLVAKAPFAWAKTFACAGKYLVPSALAGNVASILYNRYTEKRADMLSMPHCSISEIVSNIHSYRQEMERGKAIKEAYMQELQKKFSEGELDADVLPLMLGVLQCNKQGDHLFDVRHPLYSTRIAYMQAEINRRQQETTEAQ